jgi:ribosomal protein L40E
MLYHAAIIAVGLGAILEEVCSLRFTKSTLFQKCRKCWPENYTNLPMFKKLFPQFFLLSSWPGLFGCLSHLAAPYISVGSCHKLWLPQTFLALCPTCQIHFRAKPCYKCGYHFVRHNFSGSPLSLKLCKVRHQPKGHQESAMGVIGYLVYFWPG